MDYEYEKKLLMLKILKLMAKHEITLHELAKLNGGDFLPRLEARDA